MNNIPSAEDSRVVHLTCLVLRNLIQNILREERLAQANVYTAPLNSSSVYNSNIYQASQENIAPNRYHPYQRTPSRTVRSSVQEATAAAAAFQAQQHQVYQVTF